MINLIIPSRITEAREARAMSMEDLAENIGVTRQAISKYERGITSPSPEMLQAISYSLSFPLDFFYKTEKKINAGSSSLFFRSNSNIPKKIKNACKYQIKWTDEVKKQLEEYVDFIERDVPTIDIEYNDLTFDDIEEMALSIRREWGLGDEPIGDLIGVLENRGIIITQFATNKFCEFKGIDAFSCWKDGTPYIIYHSITKSAVRTRFSILHELGHLIMHNSISESDSLKKDIVDFADMQADRFAAAFLLPATSFPNDIRSTSLVSLEAVKRKWGAAMSTIIRRCETLELLTDNQVNYLKRQMTTQKYWHKEPLDDVLNIPAPEILRDAIYLLIDNGIITKSSFINSSALSTNDLKYICGLPDAFFDECDQRKKPALRLV
ncbi:MAG: helix-turn-helix domain-containing protein [Clostridia bacterium]|nr:helix-turn-helix domain-containing protein [Clostridia bacterium]